MSLNNLWWEKPIGGTRKSSNVLPLGDLFLEKVWKEAVVA